MRFDASNTAACLWEIQSRAPISAVAAYDLTKDGVQDIIIGRTDGTLEIFSFDISTVPTKVFDRNVSECITSIQIGYVTTSATQDVIITTFSGKIVAYAVEQFTKVEENTLGKVLGGITNVLTNPFAAQKPEDAMSKPVKVVGLKLDEKIAQLKKDIATLEIQNADAKTRYSNLTEEMVAVSCKYNVKTSFTLLPENACYRLSFELDCHIDMIACRSNVTLELMDVETQGFVLSTVPNDPKVDGSFFKAAFRCAENSKKLDVLVCKLLLLLTNLVQLRMTEGRYGEIECFIIPKITPKTAQIVTLPIKPLCLHQRLFSAYDQAQIET